MIILKDKQEIEKMKRAGKILAEAARKLQGIIRPGIKTVELDVFAREEFDKQRVVSAFKGYRGYPAHICTSVNEEVVHGIPGERRLKDGDVLSVDMGITVDGYCADMAFTSAVGKARPEIKKYVALAKEALAKGIRQARVGNHISDISHAVQQHAEQNDFSVVRDFVGHGIGKSLHEEPQIPNFGRPHEGPRIEEGMVLAIEPMLNLGSWEVEILDNGWTAVTKDGKLSFHFEHTVAVLEKGPCILTQ